MRRIFKRCCNFFSQQFKLRETQGMLYLWRNREELQPVAGRNCPSVIYLSCTSCEKVFKHGQKSLAIIIGPQLYQHTTGNSHHSTIVFCHRINVTKPIFKFFCNDSSVFSDACLSAWLPIHKIALLGIDLATSRASWAGGARKLLSLFTFIMIKNFMREIV